MIDFFGNNLTHSQPLEQTGFTFSVDMRKLCGISDERGDELAQEIAAKWDAKEQAVDCTCPECSTKRAAAGGEQPKQGSTSADFIDSLDLQLASPNEVLYVGLCIGKLVGKEEARLQRMEQMASLFGSFLGKPAGE